jgi:hypothetical protein
MELTKTDAQVTLEGHFSYFETQAQGWLGKAKEYKVTDESQTGVMESCREARLALRAIRINVEKKHKELKEDALRYSQALDGIKRKLTGLIEPIEAHLQAQEDFVKIKRETEKKELAIKRAKDLGPYMEFNYALTNFPLAEMGEEAFTAMLEGFKLAKEKRQHDEEEQQKAAEKKRIDDEAERTKMADENAALKAKLEKEEKRKKDEAAEKRRIARAPDKEKLEALTRTLYDVAGKFPKMSSDEGEAIIADCKIMIGKMVAHINKKMDQL